MYGAQRIQIKVPSFLRFGSWIGGDRDGNPFVTAQVTVKALRLQALEALRELLFTKNNRSSPAKDAALNVSRFHILDWVHLRKFGSQVELSEENEKMVRKLLQFEKVEPKTTPLRFKGLLRDYQKENTGVIGNDNT